MSLNAELSSTTSGAALSGTSTRVSIRPSAMSRDARVRRRSGRVSHWASRSAVMTAAMSAMTAAVRRTSVIVRVVCWRIVSGRLRVTLSSRTGAPAAVGANHSSRTLATADPTMSSRTSPGPAASAGSGTSSR